MWFSRRLLWREILFQKHVKIKKSNRTNLKSKPNGIDGGSLKKRKMVLRGEARVRKKQRIGGNAPVDDRNSDVAVDKFSELPDVIIHHIFSYIHSTKDIVRNSILSKRWKNVVDSYPLLDFDERLFMLRQGKVKGRHNRIKLRQIQRKSFRRYVERSLASKLDLIPCIDKVRVYAKICCYKNVNLYERWVRSVLEKNVKELEVHFDSTAKHLFFIKDVLKSASVTSLKFSGLFGVAEMANLRQLSLKDTNIVNELFFKKFEEKCPLIEDLRIIRCSGFLELDICTLFRLKRVEVHECTNLLSIRIEAENLETFWYYGGRHQSYSCFINLKGSGNLKNLTLRDRRMTETAFQDCISKCPLLEKLVLQECDALERLSILSSTLKSLTLVQCANLREPNIDAPNLYSFEYRGHRMSFPSMNVLGIRSAKCCFAPAPSMTTSQCFFDYHKLFGKFDQSKDFKLIIYSKQSMKIYEEAKEACQVPHVFRKLELTLSVASVLKIVDNWLREDHGKVLMVVAPRSELTKGLNSLIADRENNPNCCGAYSNKCWRHYLADVKTLTSTRAHKTYYQFKWKSRNGSLA
ncbi:putative F-box/LRR-repeat protein At5g02930 [Andrographis paniculata]|uniref:putative F-box/LRR-repeat protein At5g02930 n=1 Tax=Andrographis paniculata TaxID=175694 RepID=UPI0021E7CA1D|nr:putative F-box/LRR-repeat protein At5g02930 [Andrographis paniculata]